MVCPDQKRKKRKEGEKEDKDDDYRELYDECYKEVEKLDTKVVFWIDVVYGDNIQWAGIHVGWDSQASTCKRRVIDLEIRTITSTDSSASTTVRYPL